VRRSNNNYVLVVFDSCRYDAFTAARPKVMRKLGRLEKRWSYASWTAAKIGRPFECACHVTEQPGLHHDPPAWQRAPQVSPQECLEMKRRESAHQRHRNSLGISRSLPDVLRS
jgi:hypothetical protein